METSEQTLSIWRQDVPARELPPLIRDVDAEVCVIGAGVAGLSIAYELSLAGLNVIVLDDKTVAGGETAQTTAHLASALDDRFARLKAIHGTRGARLAYDSHAAAIDRIEQIVATVGIDCAFERVPGRASTPTARSCAALLPHPSIAWRRAATKPTTSPRFTDPIMLHEAIFNGGMK